MRTRPPSSVIDSRSAKPGRPFTASGSLSIEAISACGGNDESRQSSNDASAEWSPSSSTSTPSATLATAPSSRNRAAQRATVGLKPTPCTLPRISQRRAARVPSALAKAFSWTRRSLIGMRRSLAVRGGVRERFPGVRTTRRFHFHRARRRAAQRGRAECFARPARPPRPRMARAAADRSC